MLSRCNFLKGCLGYSKTMRSHAEAKKLGGFRVHLLALLLDAPYGEKKLVSAGGKSKK